MDTKERIIDAAVEVFSERGFHKASMDEIAKRAGVAKGTVYYNFQGKSGLFAHLVLEGYRMITEEIERELSADLSYHEKIGQIIDSNLKVLLSFSKLAKILYTELTSGMDADARQTITAAHNTYLSYVSRILSEGVQRGELKPIDADLMAAFLIGAIEKVFSQMDDSTSDRVGVVKSIQTMILTGIVI